MACFYHRGSFCLIWLLYCEVVSGQIILTDAYFPEIGDSLLTDQVPDADLSAIVFQAPGANLSWDFGWPSTRFSFTELIDAVDNEPEFPLATSRTTSSAFTFEYYQRTDTAFNLVGLVGGLPFFRGLPLSTALDPVRTLRRKGITYGDRFEGTSVWRTVVSTDSLPADILSSKLGTLLLAFDSIEIKSTSARIDEVDAYGNLRLEGYDYQVLREKRVELMETRLSLKQSGGAFFDITATVLQLDPGYGRYLGEQPSEGTYFFWAREIKEPVVEIEFDENEQPKTLLFKRNGMGDITAVSEPQIITMGISPNPLTDEFRLDFQLRRPAAVTVRLMDHAGRAVRAWELGPRSGGAETFRGSLADLVTGIYSLELLTPEGSTARKIIKR